MRQHAVGGGNSELITSAATALRTKRYWTAAAAIVYLAILIARVWGAHRFLHFEETFMVGASRSLSLNAVWNDFAYGTFIQRTLVEISSLFALKWTPIILVALAVLTWWMSTMWIHFKLIHVGTADAVAFAGPLVLCLVPLPDLAYIGINGSIGFPLTAAVIVLASISTLPNDRQAAIFELSMFF